MTEINHGNNGEDVVVITNGVISSRSSSDNDVQHHNSSEDRFERQARLQQKSDHCRKMKEEQIFEIKKLQTQLQTTLKKRTPTKRPRESIKELDAKIQELERKRTINSMPLSEERVILKEIHTVQKAKIQVEAYHAVEREVENIRHQLSVLREAHRETIGEAETTETELAQVKLANSLDCDVDELTTKDVECPRNRIGAVIGKKGSMIKQIEQLCHVQMNVHQQNDKVTVTGGEDAVQRAIAEIDKIIHTQEEDIPVDPSICNYLSARDVKVLDQWREEQPGVYMEALRGSKKVTVRADPKQIELVKMKLDKLVIVTERRQLSNQQAALVIGKKGATIDKLCEDHELFILTGKTDADSSTVTLIGPPGQVQAALDEVDIIISNNEEIETGVPVGPMMRHLLLAQSGRHMKAVQTKVRQGLGVGSGACLIYLGKESSKKKSSPMVIVKTKRPINAKAVDIASAEIANLKDLEVTLRVDPFVAPILIGKSGETIRKLAPGITTFLEVLDRDNGTIIYGASTIEERDMLGQKISEILEENTILRVKVDPDTLRSQFRDLTRSRTKAELDPLFVTVDDKESAFVLRGKKEDLEKGKTVVEDFVANNYHASVPVTAEDIEELLTGGKSSKIVELASELDVKLSIDRDNFAVIARGTKDKVDAAKIFLNRRLNGGDGYSVAKFSAGKVAGSIVGKGGKTRQELVAKYDVDLTVSKSGHVTIRGQDQSVADCRVELQKLMASSRTSRTVDVTSQQKEDLQKKEYEKHIHQEVPIQISAKDTKITLTGTLADIGDAEALLLEMLNGEYKTSIDLEPPQFAKVKSATRDPAHFKRIASSSGAKLDLDLSMGSISISGKRENVREAKEQLYVFLDFVIPGQIQRIKISKPLQQSVGRASALAEVAALASGPIVTLDRDLSVIAVRSSDPDKVAKAASLLRMKIKEAEQLVFVLELNPEEAWIIPAIIGKNGSNIAALRYKFRRCKIDISKETRTIAVAGDTEDHVQEVRRTLEDTIEKTRRGTAFVMIPESQMPRFVGKGGAHVKELASEHGVDIQRIRKGNFNFKIVGDEEKVKSAETAIHEWVAMTGGTKHQELPQQIEKVELSKDDDMGAIIGRKGAIAKSIENEFDCSLDIDTETHIVTIRCDDSSKRQAAVEKIKSIAAEDTEKRRSKRDANKEVTTSSVGAEQLQSSSRHQANSSAEVNNGVSSISSPILPTTNTNDETKTRTNPFPLYPVGVKPPANTRSKRKKNSKKVSDIMAQVKPPAPVVPPGTLDGGTETGRSLFAMLVADD